MKWRDERTDGQAGGVSLHVRRVVDPPAPPVLLLHGLGVGGAIWQSFARRLTPHLAAIAPDMRGHGQSDAPPTGYLPADYARDLLALIEHEGQPVPVIGHSLGALVALQLAEGDPKRVPWIVLLDPPLDPGIRNTEVGSVSELRHAPPGELEAYLLDRNPGGGQLLAQSLAQLFRQASDEAFSTLRDPASRTFEHPERISQPVLLLQADPAHGGVLGDAAAQAFVGRVPHGRLLKIDGAPHALHASHPAEVANAILDFAGYGGEPGSSGSR